MIIIELTGGSIVLRSEAGQVIRVPLAEAPRLIAKALEALGVSGTRYQQGWRAGRAVGYQDGLAQGYAQRDREYVISADRARQQALDEALELLAEKAKAA